MALVLSQSEGNWPSASDYKDKTLPKISRLLTEKSLEKGVMGRLLRSPWRIFLGRGNLLSEALSRVWNINGTIKQTPVKPRWIINATCYETGKNWHFSRDYIGDYVFGHNYKQEVAIADAIAASAALPYLIGKISLPISSDGWHSINPANEEPIEPIEPVTSRVRLWDAGVYENLGVEPLYKPQRGFVHEDVDTLILSDASARLSRDFGLATGVFALGTPFLRGPRLVDITTDQIRALRSRFLIEAITNEHNPLCATIVKLGNTVEYIDSQAGVSVRNDEYEKFLSGDDVAKLANFPTHLRKLNQSDFMLLLRHGYEVASTTLTGYLRSHLSCERRDFSQSQISLFEA